MGIVVADEFLIYLVQVIGLQDHTADHALSGGGLEPDLDFSEEDVELGLYGWRVAFLGDGEGGAGAVVGEGAGGGVPEGGFEGRGRVESE